MSAVPRAPWANAIKSARDPALYLPQTIAHRGYKAAWPENSMGAFKGAVDVGAHAIETDVHLSADGVVVLSHDPSLKRCFGVDKNIADCTWDYLSTIKTLKEPKQGLPRLSDLLEYLSEPGRESIWVLLDIKIDDEADQLIGALADTFSRVQGSKPWDQRIVLGCWNATFIKASQRILPTYPMALISWYLPYANHFFSIPNLGYNIMQRALVGPLGSLFLRRARKNDRQVFAWTVNDARWMEWCLRRNTPRQRGRTGPAASAEASKEMTSSSASTSPETQSLLDDAATRGVKLIDGVITDDPRLFLEVCDKWEGEQDGAAGRKASTGTAMGGLRSNIKVAMELLVYNIFAPLLYLQKRFIDRKLDLLTDSQGAQTLHGKVSSL